jgi:hypothetical protein
MLQASFFDPLLNSTLPVCPLHVLFTAATRFLLSSQQQQQVSHACAYKAAKHAWPVTVCGAAAKTHAPAVLLIKSTACSTTWRMVATIMLVCN